MLECGGRVQPMPMTPRNVELFRMQDAKAAGIYKLLPPKPYTCSGVRTLSTRLGMPKHGHESLDGSRVCCNTAGYRGSQGEAGSAMIHDLLHAPDQALHQGSTRCLTSRVQG